MNIFEDLIEELKEENLLEQTVTETLAAEKNRNKNGSSEKSETLQMFQETVIEEEFIEPENVNIIQDALTADDDLTTDDLAFVGQELNAEAAPPSAGSSEAVKIETSPEESFDEPAKPVNQAEFFRQRANNEVSALQMVDNILSGIERDFLGIEPKRYDDLEVKKNLHSFLQVVQHVDSTEQAKAEFELMQETESWYSALSQRDKSVGVSQLRRYCETTRPILSSQALISLARFYRNAPFSEPVRSKFEFVLTRLFSREIGKDFRQLLAERDDLMGNLNNFYAEWSSIPLYSTEADESNIVLAALKFEDFMTEAETADNFDELIKNDFFNRLKIFKEATHENFFAPLVAASAIESNIRIGNRYIELLIQERENSNAAKLSEKYGLLHDQTISEAVCKTIQMIDILQGKFTAPEPLKENNTAEDEKPNEPLDNQKQNLDQNTENAVVNPPKTKKKSWLFGVNKWLLALTIIVVAASLGLYVWVEFINAPPNMSANVKNVNLDNSSLKEYIQAARINNEMFYGVVTPAWDSLDKQKKEELLSSIVLIGGEKGFVKVHLMNKQGRTVANASPEKLEIVSP